MSPALSFQLEESNRTLTTDVANLASEKEELNNKLKGLQQGECHSELMSTATFFRSNISFDPWKVCSKAALGVDEKQEKNAHQK